ncbi:hypothetical protein ILUMI_12249 [Ignelater luminosus]|uniref:Craniofacial development protein 2-like n=1 Tax=Ignelater luminosus TaxID=2038154 RepID=A0A8K0GBZ4_IGNLU|nr:hypothetical protein ILUMI_12249 [Ignelater luminosus]
MKKVNIQILGISGTKKKNSGIMILRDSYVIGWGGLDSKTHARAVVAVIINKERDIIDIKYINERTITLEMALYDLQNEIDRTENTTVRIMGDLNGKVGRKNEGLERWMGGEAEKLGMITELELLITQEGSNEETDQDLQAERFDSKESYHKEHNRTKWRERDIHRYRSKMEEPQRENKKKQQVRLRSEIGK